MFRIHEKKARSNYLFVCFFFFFFVVVVVFFRILKHLFKHVYNPGPSCSKLTTSLVNDSLKFTSSDTQIC